MQLTYENNENPLEPPLFCRVLRKHLEGYIIEDIYQIDVDRIIVIEIKGRDEIGDIAYKQLYIEIMGRHSNIILVDKETEMIIDSIKHVPPLVNSYRTILPGHKYIFPPSQNKINPLQANEEDVLKSLDFNSGKLDRQLVHHFAGLSPILAKEMIHRAGIANRVTLPKAFQTVMAKLKEENYAPTLVKKGEKEYFHLIPLTHLNGREKRYHHLSEMLDSFYFGKAERDRVKQQSHDLERFIKNEIDKNKLKIKKLQQTLKKSERADEYQRKGELLTANMYAIKKGMSEIEVINYYDENNNTVNIALDPKKTPAQNAQAYFSTYQKLKNAVSIVKKQIKKAKVEITYFEHLLQQIESAAPEDIAEIREELEEEGYLRLKQKNHKKHKKKQKPVVEKYQATDGTEIFVGKNNKQNDYLTNKLAHKNDIWLHTKDIPGSHVIIKHEEPSEETIMEAAMLAAYFSKAKNSSSVPVDFTKVRHVKKPKGAKPGFVIYEHEQTVYITPNEEQVRCMRQA